MNQHQSRARYHSRKFWTWLVLAGIYGLVALFSAFTANKSWNEMTWFWLVVGAGSAFLASMHNNLEGTCTPTNDCGAKHSE